MSFNTANLITTKFGSKDLLEGKEEITLDYNIKQGSPMSPLLDDETTVDRFTIPVGYNTTEPNDEAPLCKLVYREQFGYHIEPVDQPKDMVGAMHNGVYAEIDGLVRVQLSKKLGYPCPHLIPVHDRFETQESYNILCR